jgi:hypothetical protein
MVYSGDDVEVVEIVQTETGILNVFVSPVMLSPSSSPSSVTVTMWYWLIVLHEAPQ